MNLLLLGHGYMAFALAREADHRGWNLRTNILPCSRMDFKTLSRLISDRETDIVCNAAAYIPPSGRVVDCDTHKAETIQGNFAFPVIVKEACEQAEVPLVHLSTGCLYDEAREYEEFDAPVRGWTGYCGTYVGTKLLAEKLVLEYPNSYVLRLRLPFDEVDHPRNYLTKLASFPVVFDHLNSLSHRGDFAKAAFDLVDIEAPFGLYHVVNPGQITSRAIVENMAVMSLIDRFPEIKPTELVQGTRLSTKKLLATGVKMRDVNDAVADAITRWRKA